MNLDKKGRFLKVYANLPINLRNEIIIVIPDVGPITWNATFIEVSNNTDLGEQLLNKLIDLNFI